jgi:hypothetical protein
MNDGYLLADCVFKYLSACDLIYYSNWKHDTKELYYTVSFTVRGTRTSTVSFEITVLNGNHRVTKSNIRFLEKRYSRDLNYVFVNCGIA